MRRSKSIAKDSWSRGIMRLAPLFILETHNQTNGKRPDGPTKYPSGRIMRPPVKDSFCSPFLFPRRLLLNILYSLSTARINKYMVM